MAYLGIWIGHLALWNYLVEGWVVSARDYMFDFFFSIGWSDTAFSIDSIGRDITSKNGMFVMATILTVLTVMMIGTEAINEIEDEANGY